MKKILASFLSLFMIVIMLIASITVPAQLTTGSAARFATDRAPDFEFMDTYTTTVQIDAGEKFYIKFDNGTFQLEPMPPVDLPDECDQALGMIPDWMVANLTYKFHKLDQSHRIELANLIINSPDPKYRDEIGFCIAHLSPEALQSQYFFSQVLTENAQYIYDIEPYLNYVDIVEKSDYTTLNYKNQTNVSLELPRDNYYWYVVHPKLSDELPTYIDPDHDYTADPPIGVRNYGVAPPVGKFWRDWFFNYNDTGYPLLSEYLATCNTVWDAISKCSHWVKDSMSFTSNQERPIQPVRIYRKHIGRCGEHQDIACAAARAALVPTTCTLNMAEDHVWNEFWDQRWIRWDANSKDNIDNWNYDTDMGGGKTCSTIWNTRGDSHIYSVLSRYSETCTFTATVLDSNGLPVDGADVWILSDDFYTPGAISITTWGTTDYTGNAVFELGNSRDFWASAESDNLGEDPPDQGGDDYVTKVITDSTPDATYSYTFNLPDAAPSLKATAATPPADAKNTFKLEVSYNVESSITQGYNIFSGEHSDLFGPGGNIDFFIADKYNYIKFVGNNDFETYGLDERGTTNDVSQVLPTRDNWYVVLSNEFAQRTTKIVNITVDIYGSLFAKITSPDDEAELELDSTVEINGTAFSPLGVTNVQIDIDGADNWQGATDSSGGTGNAWGTWKFEWDTTGLTPGLHNIRAKASDGTYTYITSINVTLIDVTAPIVDIDTPDNNTEFKIGEVITFEGSAIDNVGVSTIIFSLYPPEGGGRDSLSGNIFTGEWNLELETDDYWNGEYRFEVSTYDAAGNNANATIYFTLLEVTAPVVTIATPVNNSLYKLGSTIFIRGYATDNNAVNEVLLVIDNEDPFNLTAILNPINGMWYYLWDTSAEDVYEGEHIIEVQAYDPMRNLGIAQIFVNLDGSPPDASITTPTAGTLFSAGDIIIVQGTAEDDYGVASVELIFDKGKARNITENFMDGEWVYEDWDTEDLKSGEHNITVRVTDFMGHEREVSVLINIDAKLPVVDILQITDSIQIGQTITIEGTASDDIEVVILELIIGNDEPINITSEYQEDGTWSYEWNSSGALEGDLTVTVKVTDIVGKEGTAEISLKIISEATDTDEDGMPDWWEIYYGLNPDKDDAERDKDRDGIMNYDEYLGDDGQPGNDDYSDPTDPISIPAVKSSKSEKEGDLTIIWIILVIVVVIIIVLILFMTIKKKKKREEEVMAAGEVLEGEVEVAPVPPMPMPIRPEGMGNVQPATIPPIPIPMMFPIPGMMQQPVQPTPPPELGYAPPPGGYPTETDQPEITGFQQPPPAVMSIQPKIKKLGPQPKIKGAAAGSRLSLPPAGKTAESEKELEKDKDKIVSDDSVKLLAATMVQSTFDKLRLLKEQGVDVKKAEKYLELSRKALRANNYDKAIEYAGKSDDVVGRRRGSEDDDEE